jgi:integrase
VKAHVSAVFSFGVKQDVLSVNPCKGIDANPTASRERVLSEDEVAGFWAACDQIDPRRAAALRVILLTGQRPGEVASMRREHVRGNWWEMPGKPVAELGWPGTKNASSHRVYLSAEVIELIGEDGGFVFAGCRGNAIDDLGGAMRQVSAICGFDPPVTPHDLRRTAGSTITARGHGREAMDRILNHRRKSITDVYDRHDYANRDRLIMDDISGHILRLAEGRSEENVAAFRRAK